jgi:hypothetical protein
LLTVGPIAGTFAVDGVALLSVALLSVGFRVWWLSVFLVWRDGPPRPRGRVDFLERRMPDMGGARAFRAETRACVIVGAAEGAFSGDVESSAVPTT